MWISSENDYQYEIQRSIKYFLKFEVVLEVDLSRTCLILYISYRTQ